MATIPASQIVDVIPSVLAPGGNQLATVGLMVGSNTRVPIGTVQSFPTYASALAFFGPNITDTNFANIYFSGYTGSNAFPGALLYAQMPFTAVSAYLRGGNISSFTLPQLQAVNGTLTVFVDGWSRSGTVNLATASSFSAAATLIQTALNTAPTTEASVTTGSIGPQTANFNGYIAGNVLNVTSVTGGTIVVGGLLGTAGGVSGSTTITGQLTSSIPNVTGGIGTYAVSQYQAVAAVGGTIALSETSALFTVTTLGTGTISVGQTVTGTVTGSSPLANTVITALGNGLGGTGTYILNLTQTMPAEPVSCVTTNVVVTYDSISGAFIITSGIVGSASTIQFATGAVAATLLLTSTSGAVVSQGANPVTPQTFMTSVTAITADWATFFLAHDPDDANGFQSRLNFALWASAGAQNQAFLYVASDTDSSPTTTVPATASFGYALGPNGNNVTGTTLMYDPANEGIAPFVSGVIASINFNVTNGRTDLCFRNQAGLVATVTNASVASNLTANGYNFYGAYATAAATFVFLYNGQTFGPFKWIDSYINQIWMNANFQVTLMTLLTSVPSIPYNPSGYAQIAAALQTPINQAGNFGVFRQGVTLSGLQASTVNSTAGINISGILQQQGYYLSITDPGPIVRAARGSPVVQFYYTDGQDIQQIVMTSTDLL